MESSLASLFMEANLPCLPLSWEIPGESVEELQHRLMTTSMELQSAREAAALQSKLNEAKICRLQALLDAARKERDEARIKCGKLQDCLLDLSRPPRVLVPPSAQESPCSLLQSSLSSASSPAQHSYHSPTSPSIDAITFQDPKQKTQVGVDEGVVIFEGDVSAKFLPHQAQDVEDIFALDLQLDPSTIKMEDSQQQFSMDILNDDVGMDEDESLDLSELQVEQPSKPTWEGSLSSNSSWDAHALNASGAGRTLLRQTSCVSSAASQSWGANIESPKASATPCNPKPTVPSKHTFTPQLSHNPLSMVSPTNVTIADISELGNKALCSRVGTMQHEATPLVESSECITDEALDNALPEKGKLLQAVLQAGPLLQNLLLAGPLPQWRRPPPQLNTLDIPRVPMAPSCTVPGNFLPSSLSTRTYCVPTMQSPFLSHTMPLGHAKHAFFADYRGVFGASSELRRSKSAVTYERNPSVGGRKLRKLSPIGVK